MVQLRCQSCGRVVSTNIPEAKWTKAKCNSCGSHDFAEKDSDDDTWEEDNEETEEDESEEEEEEVEDDCSVCEETFPEKELSYFYQKGDTKEDGFQVAVCNKCMARNRQSPIETSTKVETRVEYIDRIIEKPVYVDKEGNKIEQESKSILPKVF